MLGRSLGSIGAFGRHQLTSTRHALGLPADMRSQKEWAAPQRQFRMPAKKVARTEQTEETRPQQKQADMERYLLQIDRQTSPRKSDA